MEISVRISGGRAVGKTTVLNKIVDLIRQNYVIQELKHTEINETIPEEHLFLKIRLGAIDAHP